MSLQISLDRPKWGTDPVPGVENARRVNLLDDDSGIIVTFVFGDDPLAKLIMELSEGLTDEQRRDISKKLLERATGLILPPGPSNDGSEA